MCVHVCIEGSGRDVCVYQPMLTKEAENKLGAHGEYCNPNFLSQSAPIYNPTIGKAQPIHANTSGLVHFIFSVDIVCVSVILK